MKWRPFLIVVGLALLFSSAENAPSAEQTTAKDMTGIAPRVIKLLQQAADAYGRMSSFQCRGVFQNESGFADAMNMSAIEGQLDSMTAQEADREKIKVVSKEISVLLDKADDENTVRTNKALEPDTLPPSSAPARKELVAKIRALLKRLAVEAPSAAFNNKETVERAISALEPAYGSYSLALARPYKVGYRTNTPALLTGSLFNDAAHLTLVDDQQREFIQKPALVSLHKIVTEYRDFFGMNPQGKLFAKTLLQDKKFLATLQKAKVIEADLGGSLGPVQVLIIPDANELGGVTRVYFDNRQHLIRKYSLDTPLLSTTETIEDISIDRPVPQDLFHFKPGANFKRVTEFTKTEEAK